MFTGFQFRAASIFSDKREEERIRLKSEVEESIARHLVQSPIDLTPEETDVLVRWVTRDLLLHRERSVRSAVEQRTRWMMDAIQANGTFSGSYGELVRGAS